MNTNPAGVPAGSARLGLARAERLNWDLLASQRNYETLIDFWKDADANLPPLQEARAEYAALKLSMAAAH